MRSVISSAPRKALAGVALLGGIVAAVEVGSYEQQALMPQYRAMEAPPPGPPRSWYYWATPWWAYTLAVVLGLLGLAVAFLVYPRPRPPRRAPTTRVTFPGSR